MIFIFFIFSLNLLAEDSIYELLKQGKKLYEEMEYPKADKYFTENERNISQLSKDGQVLFYQLCGAHAYTIKKDKNKANQMFEKSNSDQS